MTSGENASQTSEHPAQKLGQSTPQRISSGQWVLIALGTALVVALCITAGRWQFSRHEAREAAIQSVEINFDSEPVALTEVLPNPTDELPSNRAWTRVALQGHYLPQYTALLRNRPINSTPGVHVLVPFVTDEGYTLLINRGWTPQDTNYERPSTLPAPPSGNVTVVAHLRLSEPQSNKDAPAGQVQMIHVPDALAAGLEYGGGTTDALPNPYTNVYGSVDSETPASADAINPPPRPSTDPKNHLSYAFQWWVFAVGAAAGFAVLVVREIRSRRGKSAPSSNPFAQLAAAERQAETSAQAMDGANALDSDPQAAPRAPQGGKSLWKRSSAKQRDQSEEDYEDSLFE